MINIDLLQELLIIAATVSVISVAFIQKTKGMFKKSKWINPYSFVVNLILGVVFCLSFTEASIINGVWVGLFSYIGADTLYKSLEGKLSSFKDMTKENVEVEVIQRGDK